MPHKALTGIEVKDTAKGLIEAVFATLNVIDKDGDVTLPGAFTNGEKVRISAYGHKSWDGVLPVGKGEINEVGNEAILTGQFFMNTAAGRETFEVVKELGALAEFSYGFDVLENSFGVFGDDERKVQFLRKLQVHEVSPVLLGAGIGTRTLVAKAAGGGGIKLTEHVAAVLADFDELVDRIADVQATRAEKGKTLGADTQAGLEKFEVTMKRLRDVMANAPRPDDNDLQQLLVREAARFEQLRATLIPR